MIHHEPAARERLERSNAGAGKYIAMYVARAKSRSELGLAFLMLRLLHPPVLVTAILHHEPRMPGNYVPNR